MLLKNSNGSVIRLEAASEDDVDDTLWAQGVSSTIYQYGITPVAITGFILNCAVIWTWSKYCKNFQATIFLFKALAIFDNSYMSLLCVWWYCSQGTVQKLIVGWAAFCSQYMVVNVSLLLSAVRWLAVSFPFRFRRLVVDSGRVKGALATVVAYCALIKGVEVIVGRVSADRRVKVMCAVVAAQIALSIPLLLQIALSIHLVILTIGLEHRMSRFWSSSFSPESSAATPKLRFTRTNRRLTFTIVTICTVTFLAYPVGIAVVAYFKLTGSARAASVKRIAFSIVNLLQVLSSSVHFLVYCGFHPAFRRTFLVTVFRRTGGEVSPGIVPALYTARLVASGATAAGKKQHVCTVPRGNQDIHTVGSGISLKPRRP